ncbi:amino acid adenylation domain-containing protein, partial [Sphaerisporangium corydalis]
PTLILDQKEITAAPHHPPTANVGPGDLAYVIYTSGSTGEPKGAMNSHGAMLNRLQWMQDRYRLDATDRVLQKTPMSFDVSVWEFFWPLMSGARLVLARPEGHKDPAYLRDTIIREKVTTLHFVPSMLEVFLDQPGVERCMSVRRVICSGEALSAELQDRFLDRLGTELHNLYGPTEAAVDVSHWQCARGDATVPIGRPIAGLTLHVVDANLREVPAGVPGELLIGGAGVGRGYHRRPGLTARKFIPDPFGRAGGRLYRTGDRVRRRADGELEYLGRFDDQIKLRGFRIELGEIETVLARHPSVAQAAVVVREDRPGDQRLVGYLTLDERHASGAARLARLKGRPLPEGGHLVELAPDLPLVMPNALDGRFVYREIFEDLTYARHGIHLPDDACVLDVGANIGLFTLFVARNCARPRIYSFEPIPQIFRMLQENMGLHGVGAELINSAAGAEARDEVEFTYYPNASILSGQYADEDSVREVVSGFLANEIGGDAGDETVGVLLKERLRGVPVSCSVVPISQVMRERGIERVDLLKIDVEGSELDTLAGIDEADWARIDQVVVEVHDVDGRLAYVREMLSARGYQVDAHRDESLRHSALYNLYARRTPTPPAPAGVPGALGSFGFSGDLADELREHAGGLLPEYMVPGAFVVLERLPLTANGKLDRKALPAPGSGPQTSGRAPRNVREEMLCALYADVLGLTRVGIDDDFFTLGGHSLMVTRLVARIRDVLGVHVPVRAVFDAKTVARLAPALTPGPAGRPPAIIARDHPGPVRLSHGQQRLWFVEQLHAGAAVFNIPLVLRLHGELDTEALQEAVRTLWRRHASLRLRFTEAAGHPVQEIGPEDGFDLTLADASGDLNGRLHAPPGPAGLPHAPLDLDGLLHDLLHEPFDLAQGPLLRAHLIRVGDRDHILALVVHHIAADGWSLNILRRELAECYNALTQGGRPGLPPLPVQYTDYATWQRDQTATEHLDYWRHQLEDAPVLDLPTDHPRPATMTYQGHSHRFHLPPDLVTAIHQTGHQQGATPFMTLLAAFTTLLSGYTGQDDISVGAPLAGRDHPQLDDLVGFFVNTVVIRTRLTGRTGQHGDDAQDGGVQDGGGGEPTFRWLLDHTRDTTLSALDHQDLPFDHLVDTLLTTRDPARTPLFQVAFALQNTPADQPDLTGLTTTPIHPTAGASQFDLTMSLEEDDHGLHGVIEYRTDLFTHHTIERLADHYRTLLTAVTADPDRPLSHLPVLVHEGERWREPGITAAEAVPDDGPATPRDGIEHDLAAIWRDVLDVPAVGRHDNFFDIGGNSMLLVGVRERIRTELGREIAMVDLFRMSSLRALAGHLAGDEPPPPGTSSGDAPGEPAGNPLLAGRRRARARRDLGQGRT